MNKTRTPKKGLVYLLISECGNYAKYGASTNLKSRLYRINKENPFNCIYAIKKFAYCVDIYYVENEIKYKLWSHHIGISEFFEIHTEFFPKEKVVSIFEDVCLKEGAICS